MFPDIFCGVFFFAGPQHPPSPSVFPPMFRLHFICLPLLPLSKYHSNILIVRVISYFTDWQNFNVDPTIYPKRFRFWTHTHIDIWSNVGKALCQGWLGEETYAQGDQIYCEILKFISGGGVRAPHLPCFSRKPLGFSSFLSPGFRPIFSRIWNLKIFHPKYCLFFPPNILFLTDRHCCKRYWETCQRGGIKRGEKKRLKKSR